MVILTFALASPARGLACVKNRFTQRMCEAREKVGGQKNAPVWASQTFGVVNEDAFMQYRTIEN